MTEDVAKMHRPARYSRYPPNLSASRPEGSMKLANMTGTAFSNHALETSEISRSRVRVGRRIDRPEIEYPCIQGFSVMALVFWRDTYCKKAGDCDRHRQDPLRQRRS